MRVRLLPSPLHSRGRSMRFGDCTRRASGSRAQRKALIAQREDEGSNPSGSISTPLWCQGQHAPFVRLQRRFDSCRRLSNARGRSSDGRAPGFHPGEARSTRVVRFYSEACGVTAQHRELQPRWSGFESWRACSFSFNDRRGPERLGYHWRSGYGHAVRHRNPIAPHDRDDTSATPAAGRSRTVLGHRRPTQVGSAQ